MTLGNKTAANILAAANPSCAAKTQTAQVLFWYLVIFSITNGALAYLVSKYFFDGPLPLAIAGVILVALALILAYVSLTANLGSTTSTIVALLSLIVAAAGTAMDAIALGVGAVTSGSAYTITAVGIILGFDLAAVFFSLAALAHSGC